MLWIMSQDRNKILTIKAAYIYEQGKNYYISCDGAIEFIPIGTYATEERAKEVLAEIFNLLRCTESRTVITYEMPLE